MGSVNRNVDEPRTYQRDFEASSQLFCCNIYFLKNKEFSLQQLTFVDNVLLVTAFDLPAVRSKFSCKNTPKFTARRPAH